MAGMLALIISTLLSYGMSALIDPYVSGGTSLMISLIFGTVAYAFCLWGLKRLRGD